MTRWIHGISFEMLRAAFCEYFGVSGEHADVLIVLFERAPDRVGVRELQTLLSSHRPPRRSFIYERVRVLREIMEAEALDSGGQLDAAGYALTEIGVEECRKALKAAADALMKHGPLVRLNGENVEEIRARSSPSQPLRKSA